MSIQWKIDPAHSEIQFKVKHLMISTVTGYFKKFDLEVETESNNFTTAKRIVFTAAVDSLDTGNAQRDTHLRSNDFFNADAYPQIKFIGKKYESFAGEATLHGDLTIRDVTKPVILQVEFGGIVPDAYGQIKAGFTVEGKINRKDFNLLWNGITEAGHVVVSDEVRIHAQVQLVKQKEAVTA